MPRAHRSKTPPVIDPFHPVEVRVVTPEDSERLAALRSDGCAPSPLSGRSDWATPTHPRSKSHTDAAD